MGILRKVEYKDKETRMLQSSLDRDFDEIENRINNLSDSLKETSGEVSNFSFPNPTQDGNHAEALKFFDRDLSNLTGFPSAQDLNFADYQFETVDPIKVVFDQHADLGQPQTIEFDLRDFYRNLSAQYAIVFGTLQDMVKQVNSLMDIIQKFGIEVLEDLLNEMTTGLRLVRYIFFIVRLDFRQVADINQYERGGERYLQRHPQRSQFPAGFNFNAHQAFDLRGYAESNLPAFDRAALNQYLRRVFDNSNVASIDLSQFNTEAE